MSSERKYVCPDCLVRSAYWNTELDVGYCFTCLEGKFKSPFESYKIPEVLKPRKNKPKKAKLDPDALFREIMESDWGIPEKDQKRLLEEGKMAILSDYTVSFRCFGGSLTQNRSLFRSQKGWRMEFSDENNRETTIFSPFPDKKSSKSGRLVICEGILDSIRIAQAADWVGPAYPVAVLGTNLGPTALSHLVRLKERWGLDRAFLWMDPDRAGVLSNKKIRKQMPRYLFPQVEFVFTDLEPADMPITEVRKVLKECILSE